MVLELGNSADAYCAAAQAQSRSQVKSSQVKAPGRKVGEARGEVQRRALHWFQNGHPIKTVAARIFETKSWLLKPYKEVAHIQNSGKLDGLYGMTERMAQQIHVQPPFSHY